MGSKLASVAMHMHPSSALHFIKCLNTEGCMRGEKGRVL